MKPQKIGRYEIKSVLGRGGMAIVYRAYDPIFEREVAIKTLPHRVNDEGSYQQFNKEIKIIGQLEHPSIVPVYDVGYEHDQPFFVMRFVRGGTLEEKLLNGPLSIWDVVSIIDRLSSALDAAHAKGVIHLDIKPRNILFDDNDEPFISDFGIASILPQTANSPSLFHSTKLGEKFANILRFLLPKSHSKAKLRTDERISIDKENKVIGTPRYMSPEQAKGEKLDGRSDIYSLGVVLFEMLSGKTPYQADTPVGLAYKHVHEPIPDIIKINPNLHPLIGTVIQKALAKNREERFSTASDLSYAIKAIANDAVEERTKKRFLPKKSQTSSKKSLTEKIFSADIGFGYFEKNISRYVIKTELGRGTFSIVYRAYDPLSQKDVAIRILNQEHLENATSRERFNREVQIVAQFKHPAVVPIYDSSNDNGQLFYVMPYMAGGSLSDHLTGEQFTLEESLPIIQRIADAVNFMDSKGIIHRNLKPTCILFDEHGDAFVSDFFIAKHLTQNRLTAGGLLGTPTYISPEQALSEELDTRTNIYSLGIILFEMLSGKLPYEATSPLDMVVRHVNEPIPHILDLNPNLPAEIEYIFEKALAKDKKNRFSTITEFSDALQNILSVSSNRYIYTPEDKERLKKSRLDLSNKGLLEIPKYVFESVLLESLDLSHNRISVIPEEISKLTNLRLLNLNNNELSNLPSSIGELQQLTGLVLSNNQFTALPESILELKNLISLDLRDNKISFLPLDFEILQKLFILELGNNPLIRPPVEVVKQGVNAIREYLNQISQGQEYLYEAKLLILGEGGAGKTTLARKILNPGYSLLQDEKSTEGIDVLRWSFPLENKKKFRVNIWDFGGQEIYHTTHQYFLTKRSLYVLVADTRKEDTDFYYWLNVVELLSDNSPLIIIKNEKQDRHREINERLLRGQFENLRAVLATNLADNRGLDIIIDEIKHYSKNLPHIGSQLPSTWVRVREILENDARNYISLNEYLEMCHENGFADVKNSLQLSDYLHDLGVFLHFQNDPILKNTIILKPKWGTDAAYKVLDNQTVIRNLGQFTRTELSIIWDEPIYAGMYDELLQLMMKFHLCYEIPNTNGTYIAPQLLTENQPQYDWDIENNLVLRYTYEFMPKGILTQFIVIMHHLILEQQYVWKSGLIIEKDKTRAEIIEYYGKKEIRIRVKGAFQVELMAIVMFQLDQIHATYKRLKYDKLIPCNCPDCHASQEPHFYRYEELQNFTKDKQKTIQCRRSYKMVNVQSLIAAIFPNKSRSDKNKGSRPEKRTGEKAMTKYEVNIAAGAKIDALVLGSEIENSFIRESFNKISSANISDELKQTLQQLVQAVDIMSKSLPGEQSLEVTKDIDTLVQEATKKSPRQKWYQLSVDGLIKAAENVGKIGQPVIELASKVISLLMLTGK